MLLSGFGAHGFPVMHALLFALLSALSSCSARSKASGPRAACSAAGICAGIAALFRHDMGLYTVFSETLLIAWWIVGLNQTWRERIERLVRMLTSIAVGVLLVVVPPAIWLLAQVPLNDLCFNLLFVPSTIYPRVRALPWPPFPDHA